MHEMKEQIIRTKRKRTENEKRMMNANETNEKRKRYEISVKLNDPGSVTLIPSQMF